MENNCKVSLLDYIQQYSGKHNSVPPDDVNEDALIVNMKVADDIIFEVITRSSGGM